MTIVIAAAVTATSPFDAGTDAPQCGHSVRTNTIRAHEGQDRRFTPRSCRLPRRPSMSFKHPDRPRESRVARLSPRRARRGAGRPPTRRPQASTPPPGVAQPKRQDRTGRKQTSLHEEPPSPNGAGATMEMSWAAGTPRPNTRRHARAGDTCRCACCRTPTSSRGPPRRCSSRRRSGRCSTSARAGRRHP